MAEENGLAKPGTAAASPVDGDTKRLAWGAKGTTMSDPLHVSRSNLRQGAVYMMVGLVWGVAIPATPFPRLGLGAHLQLTTHGIMFVVAGLVILHLRIANGSVAGKILLAGPWLTWPVMLTEMANAWWGTRNTLPIAAEQAGAAGAGAWQENIVTAAHLLGAVVLLVYWGTILGWLFRKSTASGSDSFDRPGDPAVVLRPKEAGRA